MNTPYCHHHYHPIPMLWVVVVSLRPCHSELRRLLPPPHPPALTIKHKSKYTENKIIKTYDQIKNMGSPKVTLRNPFFYLSPLNDKLSVQSKSLFKIFQLDHYIVIKVQKHNYSLSPVSLPTFFLSFSAFI